MNLIINVSLSIHWKLSNNFYLWEKNAKKLIKKRSKLISFATSLQFCVDKTQWQPTSYLAGVSCGLWSVVAEKMGLTLVPSAGLCTTVVWASWGEVGDTLPCREGDGSGLGGWARGKRKGVGKGTRKRCRGIPTNKTDACAYTTTKLWSNSIQRLRSISGITTELMAPNVSLTTSTAVYRIIVEPQECEKKQSPAKRTFRTTAEEEGSTHSSSTRLIQSVH